MTGCNNTATTDGTGGGASVTPTNATPQASAPTNNPTAVVMPYGVPIPHDTAPPPPPSPVDAGVADAGKPKAKPQPQPTAVPAYGLPMPTSSNPLPK